MTYGELVKELKHLIAEIEYRRDEHDIVDEYNLGSLMTVRLEEVLVTK